MKFAKNESEMAWFYDDTHSKKDHSQFRLWL